MATNSNKQLCLEYLHKYAQKDLDGVSALFAENITLRDWKISVTGKANAIAETAKNFGNTDSIEIAVLSTYENEDAVAAELKITIAGKEELFVMDVVTFDMKGKIKSIRAYLGRGN